MLRRSIKTMPAIKNLTGGPGGDENAPAEPPRGRATILIVDDEKLVRTLLSEILTGHGYQVLEASGGEEALEFCRRHAGPIDLLLSDVRMPAMTGPELALQATSARPDMKLLYISAYSKDSITDVDASVPFLSKPFTPQALLRKIRAVLNGREAHAGRHRIEAEPRAPTRVTSG
jgi:two-component system cell cycle sensor histidine kinase/response regulator CckA